MANELPRFNMPFELGLAMGTKYFGGPSKRRNSVFVMIAEPYALPVYLSDLGGNDPQGARCNPEDAIRIVLGRAPDRRLLPGAQFVLRLFTRFKEKLPEMARVLNREHNEVAEFLKAEQEAAQEA